ncbi:formate-dependent phosphoribosylglycinamide formyltransferase [Corynebacterium sp. ED61]|uniref:formate-dependent phosphoribosylglycinamide formyltransferase n=1 Tax=Corynebacterium sp. ED61 TaxID=2211360 RepID=UPI0018844259|nr:formate-dependent phosphoribosylglycinamide formyltransferase [Corynebacterium sp. ED61]MBF0581786.1 formate-dependent phosphoribosylglycinamide formyltransferase [Corynebacterium sp. ED61]
MYTPESVGTPLSDNATTVLLLGSGELGREVTFALQRLGVEVHAADRYEGAPAHHTANYAHVLDMTDGEQVRELVERVRPDFVVPEIESLATKELERIEEEGLATVIPTARAARLTMDREGIRDLAYHELGLPTSAYVYASSYDELYQGAEEVGYPCVVKPIMSSSGKGQSYVANADELSGAWEYAMSGARVSNQRVIVEQFIPFDYEITLLTIRSIDPETDRDATWFCEPIGHRQDRGDYVESWQPAAMSETALDNARSVAARITNALGGRGVFGVELFVKGDDVYFSEVSPRPHDTGMVTMATQRFSEFDLHARAILGLPIDSTLVSPGASAVIYGVDSDGPVSFSGLADAMSVPETDVRLFGKPESFSRRRMGVAISTAEDVAQGRERAVSAAERVKVNPS